MTKQLSIFFLFLIICFLSVTIAKAQPIIITPKWTAQAQFTGYYVAEKMGFYKEEGLDVHVQHPSLSESSYSYLEKGRAQVAVMNLSYALMEWAKGAKIINILQTSQENSLMLVGHTPFKGISSLQHKKIAVWNHLSEELLDQMAKNYNLQVEWIRFNSGINLFLSKATDICLVGSYNEFPQLKECGMEVDSTHILRFADYGYNLPEDGLYVSEKFYHEHPETVKKLANASMRGWKWANEHPEEALNIVMEQVSKHNIGTNRYHQRKMMEEVLRLQIERESGQRTYHLSREKFEQAIKILFPSDIQKMPHLRYDNFVK